MFTDNEIIMSSIAMQLLLLLLVDYPSCLIKPEVKKVLNKSIRDCSFDMLQVFVEQLIQSITTDMSKGVYFTLGY